MKVKIIVEADVEGPINLDMFLDVHDKMDSLPFVNGILEVYIDPVIAPIKRRKK